MTFFKRGSGPLASILIPTRGKPKSLLEAIDSVYSLASKKSNVEFIVKIDTDDQETIDMVCGIQGVIPLRSIISPRGKGYADMHHWLNDMCAIASGDWLYLFNDDARLKTDRWDEMLEDVYIIDARPGTEDVCMFYTPTIDRPEAKEFMFLRNTVYKLLGHWSLSPYADYWIRTVMGKVGLCYKLPIFVEHLNPQGGNKNVNYPFVSETISSTRAIRAMTTDEIKLLDYIDAAIVKADWNPEKYYISCLRDN